MVEYKALNSTEAVQTRPEQFIGSTENSTQLAKEVIDNAIDELVNDFASFIAVNIDQYKHVCQVIDNGRGIKIENIQLDSGEVKDSVEVLFTHLFSGSKFDSSVYSKLYGMHGVGLVAVNSLSEYVKIYTRDRINKELVHYYEFQNSKLVQKSQLKIDGDWSTIIEFKPSEKYFSSLEFETATLGRLLLITKSRFQNVTIYFNNKELPHIPFDQLVRSFLNLKDDEELFTTSYSNGDCGIQIFFTYSKDSTVITGGDINCRPASGRFIDNFKNIVVSILEEKLKAPKRSLTSGLRIYISLFLPTFEIDAQIKSKIVSDIKYSNEFKFKPKKTKGVTKAEFPVLEWIKKTVKNDYIQQIVLSHLNIKVKNTNKRRKKRVESLTLRDCRKIPGEILYLVEGESALGPVDTIRNKQTEAVFPISGKIPNIETMSWAKLQESVKIKDLKEVIGSENNYRYKKIKLVFDADADGGHIVTLLLVFLAKFAKKMIQDGNVSIVITPLYIAKKGKQIIPVYSIDDINQYVNQGHTIKRIKGLGEMSTDEFRTVLTANYEYVVEYPENFNDIISIVKNTNLKVSLMNSNKTKFETLLNFVNQN
jgi:DNA gyrase/topoisomerase IV subunit B